MDNLHSKLQKRISSDSQFGIVGRDMFRLAFRTLNQAVFEQDVS
jgi:hypothetical protein